MITALASLALLLAQGAAPASTPAPARAPAPVAVDPKVAAQVPVIAGKLKAWRGTWGVAGGKLGCKTITSTGDSEIDLIGCKAVLECVKPAYPELRVIADSAGAEDDKKRRMSAKLAGLESCLAQHRGQGIAALARARGSS